MAGVCSIQLSVEEEQVSRHCREDPDEGSPLRTEEPPRRRIARPDVSTCRERRTSDSRAALERRS